MSKCPHCRRSFQTLEDEIGMHDCPHCGYFPEPEVTCAWCNAPMSHDIDDEENAPYCSSQCALHAERDSEEDNTYEAN